MADPSENQLVTVEEQADNFVQPVKPKATQEQEENAENKKLFKNKSSDTSKAD